MKIERGPLILTHLPRQPGQNEDLIVDCVSPWVTYKHVAYTPTVTTATLIERFVGGRPSGDQVELSECRVSQ